MTQKIIDPPGFSGQPWPQYPQEIKPFIQCLKGEGCISYAEVGCRYGDTYHAVGRSLPPGSRVVAVDLPGAKSGFKNKGGHQNSGEYLHRAAADLRSRGYDTHVIIGDSQASNTIEKVSSLAPFDCIFIDGDHTAKGVWADWRNYSPMARMVAFHDIAGDGRWAKQIRPIFHKCREGRRWQEFVHDGLRRGIGVVWLG